MIARRGSPPPLPTTRRKPMPPPLPPAARPTEAPPRDKAPSYSDLAETKRRPRASAESLERLHALLGSLKQIRAASTPWQVASTCASALAKALDTRGAVVHHYDPATRELRIIGIEGTNTEGLLGSVSNADDDFVAINVLASGGTMRVKVDGELPELAPERLRTIGTRRSIIAVPVMNGTNCVALLELVDVDELCEPLVSEVCQLLSEQLLRVLQPGAALSEQR